MPVSQDSSTPARQAAILGFGVFIAILTTLFLITRFDASRKTEAPEGAVPLGSAAELAEELRETGPMLLPDPVGGTKNIYVTHTGDEDTKNWHAFLAVTNNETGTCALAWAEDKEIFTNPCDDTTYPANGEGLQHFLITVNEDNDVVLNLGSVK